MSNTATAKPLTERQRGGKQPDRNLDTNYNGGCYCAYCEHYHCVADTACEFYCGEHMFKSVYCSNCGGEFGPGPHGFSHCYQHEPDFDGDEDAAWEREQCQRFDEWRDGQLFGEGK